MPGIRPSISGSLAMLSALCTLGCFGPTYNWNGQWLGNRHLKGQPGARPDIVWTAGMVDLILRPGGTFEMFELGAPKSGTYRTSDGKAYLHTLTFFDKPISEQGQMAVELNKEIVLTPIDKNTIELFDPGGFDKTPIRLARQASDKPIGT